MFGRMTLDENYAKQIKEINEGQRREPQHDVPPSLPNNGRSVDPVDQFAFEEFAWLGAALDWATDASWSFEETRDTRRRAHYLDSPEHSRRWIIYFNGLQLGWLEVVAAPEGVSYAIDDYHASPMAVVDMSLSLMRFVPSECAFGILHQTAFFMQSTEAGYDVARERALTAADSAMTHYLWDVMRAGDDYVPDLIFSARGPYSVFRETIAHWKASDFNPFHRKRR